MTKTMKYTSLVAAFVFTAVIGCKKNDEKPKTVPSVTTATPTDLTTSSAKGGGTINSDGGATITEAGVVYSNTNLNPTTSDSKMTATATSGSFTVDLTGLQSGKTYYVRAYATNSIGTGYGDAMTFMTGNAGPEARNISVSGTPEVAKMLTATYTYYDSENDPEGTPAYQWYMANDSIGATVVAISGATGSTYVIDDSLSDRFLYVAITPKATSGTTPGAEAKSRWYGPVGGETVTFTYMGQSVTYGVIKSSVTGRKWMDRNIGAQQTATAYNDYLAYGDLFQWGRLADGHQVINWTGVSAGTAAQSTTNTLSTTDTPPNSMFIVPQANPYDWRATVNNNLWQPDTKVNDPCPTGWHIPTNAEWVAENVLLPADAYDKLKIVVAGYRSGGTGAIRLGAAGAGGVGNYWSSSSTTADDQGFPGEFWSYYMHFSSSSTGAVKSQRAGGKSVRCIKN